MAEEFRDVLQALRNAAVAQQATHTALVTAAEANQRTGQAMVRAIEAVLHIRDEHEDLRETVQRLESLVMQQGVDIRELRSDIRRLRPE